MTLIGKLNEWLNSVAQKHNLTISDLEEILDLFFISSKEQIKTIREKAAVKIIN
tara:strand:- start:95 stop:256 length:162 start_codon:yes stop_codon:yes gene_type:complete